jgi:uncharacterized membrane protein YeaQ/YmgE (transglycosylase-associated protein family)
MSIIAWLVVGFLAGWIANMIMSSGAGGLLADILVGIVGALAGGFIMGVVTGRDYLTGINIESILVSIVGAIVVIAAYRALTRQPLRQ